MSKTSPQSSNTLIWIICAILALVGMSICIHAALNFNQANVVVEWSTASELNTVGFNLLRGETPAGPFAQVNEQLIPAASDTLTGGSYSYEDPGVKAGTTYFYMLEEIESSGNANQHGPITVEASNPAQIELLIGGLLILGAVVYAAVLLREQKSEQTEIK